MGEAQPAATRARIRAVAVELFTTNGIDRTSLREIAAELGITKAAVYYHFRSKDALVRSLVAPFLEEIEGLLADAETTPDQPPHEFLASYFDLFSRHRGLLQLLMRDLSAVAHLGLEHQVMGWASRAQHLLVGRAAAPADQVRAIVALGGLQDAASMPPEGVSAEEARPVAVEAACAALGLKAEATASPRRPDHHQPLPIPTALT